MSRDLRDLLSEFAEEEGQASVLTAPAPGLEARLLGRRVARRRAARAGAVSLTSAAAVVGLAVGVSALTGRGEDPPPTTTTPSPSVTPTPTPTSTSTPEVTETPEVILPPVTEHPLLPDAEPMPPGTFERTGPGWVLIDRALATAVQGGDPPIEHTYFYLLDPEGTRYEVPFGTDRSLSLADWLPGTSTVVVQLGGLGDFTGGTALLDLETGEFTDLPVGSVETPQLTADGGVLVRVDSEVRRYGSDGSLTAAVPVGLEYGAISIDASRTRIAVPSFGGQVQVFDARTLDPVTVPGLDVLLGGRSCSTATWVIGSSLAVGCQVGEAGTEYWLVPPDGPATGLEIPTAPDGVEVDILDVEGDLYAAVPESIDGEGFPAPQSHLIRLGDGPGATPLASSITGRLSATGRLVVGWVTGPAGEALLMVLDPQTGESKDALGGSGHDPTGGQTGVTWWVVAR